MPGAIDIHRDIVATLRSTGLFACVIEGDDTTETAVPRATVLCRKVEYFQPDDIIEGRWARLVARVLIRTRSDRPSEAIARALELADAAVASLLEDPYRGGRCQDLPLGAATEVDGPEFDDKIKPPEVQVAVTVRCHCEQLEA